MYRFFLGLIVGVCFIAAVQYVKPRAMGAVPSNGDLIGIYNATPADLTLGDGYGSALLTDRYGRLVTTRP